MRTVETSEPAAPVESAADTIAIVVDQRLLRECAGPELAARLPGYNLRLLGWPGDLVELGDWCAISLVVLWISRPGADFESAFEAALEAATSNRPIAILSDFCDPGLVARALTHGVRGYLSPGMGVAELAGAIRFVAEGGTYIPPSMLDSMTSARPAPALPGRNGELDLSPRQLEVLERLHEGKPNKIIAYELGMAEATVKVHIRMIMRKLNATNRTQVVLRTKRLQQDSALRPVISGTIPITMSRQPNLRPVSDCGLRSAERGAAPRATN